MKRSIAAAIAAALLVALAAVCCAGCTHGEWNDGSYDLSLPDIGKITATSGVSEEGWYLVFEDEFDKGDTNSSNLQSALNASTNFGEVYKEKYPEYYRHDDKEDAP